MKIHKEGAVTILMALVFAVLDTFLHTDGIRSILHLLLQGA